MIYATVKTNEKVSDVLEKTTKTHLNFGFKHKKAEQICEMLNEGSGFNGWTPIFFTTHMKGNR